MTGLPAVSLPLQLAAVDRRHHGRHGRHDDRLVELSGVDHRHHGRHVGTTGTAARCQVDDRETMSSLPSCPPSIIGTGTTAGEAPALARSMTALPAVSLPLELAGVDRRHHGDRAARRHGHGRGKAPALARSMTALPATSAIAPLLPGVQAGACQVDDRLARRQLALGTGRRRSSAPRAAR